MDSVFEAATKRLDELKQEVRKLEEFVGTYRMLALEFRIDALNSTGTTSGPTHADATEHNSEWKVANGGARRTRVTDNPPPAVVVASAANLIREAGRPLSRREIHNALAGRGVVVRGSDPVKALGTMLWRSGKGVLTQIEGRGYWVADEPVPHQNPAGELALDD